MNALDTRNAIQQYCSSNHVDYAILIDGDWGTGKTEFVRKYLDTFHKDSFLHISLFGLSTINEIENEIYKSMAFIDQNEELCGAFNSISLSSDQARFGGIGFAIKSVFEYYKQDKIKNSKRLIICLDDLERWNGDIDICLSYVAKLVEQYNTRTIIICAQNRLDENDN
ncbi:P-loop NTPase fold protein, partial [Vibrio harveyi]